MDLWLTVRVALQALARNKMRSGLTVLGIVIGVAAVILMVALGQGANALVMNQFNSLGTNVVIVLPGSQAGGGVQRGSGSVTTLTAADSQAIERECESVAAASPILFAREQLIFGNVNWLPNEICGVDLAYLTVRNWGVDRGGYFTERDLNSAAKVCVIGATISDELFQTSDPIGKTIRIKNIPFVVQGVLQRKGANLVGQDQDNIVLAPYTTVKKRLSGSAFQNVDCIFVSARSVDHMADAVSEIEALLRDRHHLRAGSDDDFTVRNTSEVANVLGIVTGVMTLLLSSIAGVSLVVGGVGIMNIMLVSVTERTREIGVRLAIGARGRDILWQFLVESILLSTLGGLLGVALGVGGSWAVSLAIGLWMPSTGWPWIIPLEAIGLSLGFAAAVGMFFGYYPAYRASQLDPIECLRFE